MLMNKNYTEIFPGYNFNKILPELKIDSSGYSSINKDEILKRLDEEAAKYKESSEYLKKNKSQYRNFNFLFCSKTFYTISMVWTE